MKYLLLIHGDEARLNAATPATASRVDVEFAAFNEALAKAGIMLGRNRLQPTNSARRVRVANGRTEVVDGPYSDTKEQLGGYYVIDVPSVDEAVAWAARCPAAKFGTVEVRPILPVDGQ